MAKSKFCRGFFHDGMLKYKGTYEIISPDDIGLTRANDSGIVLGKLRYHASVTPTPMVNVVQRIFCDVPWFSSL